MAYPKTQVDYQLIERLSAEGLNLTAIDKKLGKVNFSAVRIKKDDEFLAAFNAGRKTAGLEPYQKRQPKGSKKTLEPQAFDADTNRVLTEIEDNDGINEKSLCTSLRMAALTVARSIRILTKAGLVHGKPSPDGLSANFHAGANGNGGGKTTAADRRKGPRDSAASTSSGSTDAPAQASAANTPPPRNSHSLNGHTESVALAMEAARVELLYQRVHQEPSPKCLEVIERIEGQLEELVKAKAAAA